MCSVTQCLDVKIYGEAEFWMSGSKVAFVMLLVIFTFVSMLGGNPQHERFGFRNWNEPGPIKGVTPGEKARSFLDAFSFASFMVVGPEYPAMIAGEAKFPRKYVKTAFKTMYWRFLVFFILPSLCVGILLPYDNPSLVNLAAGINTEGTISTSPFVIAMDNLRVRVLPHVVISFILVSIISATNTYIYCSSRMLYALAEEGQTFACLRPYLLYKFKGVPIPFRRHVRLGGGTPINCLVPSFSFACLSFLSVSQGSMKVLIILARLVNGGALVNYFVISVTYVFGFHPACKAQGIGRTRFRYNGRFQPVAAWVGLIGITFTMTFYGYKEIWHWSTMGFFQRYGMFLLFGVFFGCHWSRYRQSFVDPQYADLILDSKEVDEYERIHDSEARGFWADVSQMFHRAKAKEFDLESNMPSVNQTSSATSVPMSQ